MKKKGYVFSFDTFMGIFLAITIFSITSYSLTGLEVKSFGSIAMKRAMDDSMNILDREGILQNLDSDKIQQILGTILPVQYSWRIKIIEYDLTNKEFKNSKEFLAENSSADLLKKEIVAGKRIFLTFKNNEIDKYYEAKYWAWLKDE